MDRAKLNAALINAHAVKDLPSLVAFYTEAADQAEAEGDTDACCFYLTHAYVFALQSGAQEAGVLHQRLVGYGREE